jgi:hypothetical protein
VTWLLLLPCVLLGALTFRVRGGLTSGWRFQLPGQVARVTWAIACAVTVLAAGSAWWQAAALVPAAWAVTTLPLLGAIDMGRNDGSFARDFALGTVHGLSLGAPAAAVLFATAPLWWLPLAGGALWSACYALCWLRRDWPELRAIGLGRYGNPPEAAEVLFGAQFGAILFAAVG